MNKPPDSPEGEPSTTPATASPQSADPVAGSLVGAPNPGGTLAVPVDGPPASGGQPPAQKGSNETTSCPTVLRRGTAFVVLLATVVLFVASHYRDDMRVCQDEVAEGKVVEVCEPYPIEDVAPALALVLALLWADLGSIELAGIATITRRLERQEQTQDELVRGQERVETQLQTLQITAVSQGQSQGITNILSLAPYVRDITELKTSREPGIVAEEPAPPRDDAETGSEALRRYWRENLKSWAALGQRLAADPYLLRTLERAAADEKPFAEHAEVMSADRQLLQETETNDLTRATAIRDWAHDYAAQLEFVREVLRLDERADPGVRETAFEIGRKIRAALNARLERN